jgi:hypothetical protein
VAGEGERGTQGSDRELVYSDTLGQEHDHWNRARLPGVVEAIGIKPVSRDSARETTSSQRGLIRFGPIIWANKRDSNQLRLGSSFNWHFPWWTGSGMERRGMRNE